ncbi:ricin B-like lectin [Thelephora ganbajun]|uniref:Ricin B-like lectin n=1 Tax=Thelephora ganbajun TaxID=370292 RepID=A0ACB6ZAE0_THEGA|nr:ricin B-like lectin [Thelephora ganbajun]
MSFEGKTFYIINKRSGTVMDLSTADQTSVTGWEHHGGDNQKWRIVSSIWGSSGYWIQNVASEKYLNTEYGPGDYIRLEGSESPCQWHFRPDERDSNGWRLFVRGTGYNAELANNGDSTSGTHVTLRQHMEGENQVWYFWEVDPTNPSNTL